MIAAQSTEPAVAPVRIRRAAPSDLAFIVDGWRNSWRLAQTNCRKPSDVYHHTFDRLVVHGILAEPDTTVIVACDQDEPDVLLGWLCYTPGVPTLHYAYVRAAGLRRRGLFSVMVAAMGVSDGGALAYTFRPCEHASSYRRRPMGVEAGLLAAAERRGIATRYVPVAEFLGRKR